MSFKKMRYARGYEASSPLLSVRNSTNNTSAQRMFTTRKVRQMQSCRAKSSSMNEASFITSSSLFLITAVSPQRTKVGLVARSGHARVVIMQASSAPPPGEGQKSEEDQSSISAKPSQPEAYVKPKMSEEQRAKLRAEYLGLGGSTNTSMGQNWFLNIMIFVSILAVMTKLTGALG